MASPFKWIFILKTESLFEKKIERWKEKETRSSDKSLKNTKYTFLEVNLFESSYMYAGYEREGGKKLLQNFLQYFLLQKEF